MAWSDLADIASEARQDRDDERRRPPVACPNDGTPLVERDGVWHCPFDGWEWNGSSPAA